MVSIFNVCEIERELISHVVLEISSLMNFLECGPCIPRPETDQEIEQAIREIKRKVGLPLDDPKSAATIHASNQSADKTLHTTTFTGKSPKSSTNKIRSGRVAKIPFRAKTFTKTARRKNEQRVYLCIPRAIMRRVDREKSILATELVEPK